MSLLRGYWSTDRSLTVLLVSLILVIFVIQPLGALGIGGRLVMTVFFSLILISGVGAVAKSGLTTKVVGGLVVASLGIRWTRVWLGGGSLIMSNQLFSSIFCAILSIVVLAQVFRPGRITWQRIQGAVAVYLLLGLAWAFAYELVRLHWPDAFAGAIPDTHGDLTPQFVYFSFVTLTTCGYGDIAALHPVARSLVTFEMLIGQLFPAVLLARLVSMEVFHRQAAWSEPR